MAQIVRQRATSPYPIVIVSILFILSLGAAVYFYLQYDKQQLDTAYAAKQTQLGVQTIVACNGKIAALARCISPDTKTYDEGITAFKTFEGSYPAEAKSGILNAFSNLKTELENIKNSLPEIKLAASEQAKIAAAKITTLESTIAGKDETIETLKSAAAIEIAKLDEREAKLIEKTDQIDKKYADKIIQKDTKIVTLTQKLDKLELLEIKQTSTIKTLKETISALGSASSKVSTNSPAGVGIGSDGVILKVLEDKKLCYINLGSADGIKPYSSFTVYDCNSTVPANGAGKGRLVVSSVSKNSSECKIVSQDKSNPLQISDLIANIAFSKTKTFTFVVAGAFDLRGGHRPTPAAREAVKAMILLSGGKIAKALSIETDFLVLGAKPTVPPKPGQNADLQAFDAYKDALAKLNAFNSRIDSANNLGVRVLNTNSFLALMGK